MARDTSWGLLGWAWSTLPVADSGLCGVCFDDVFTLDGKLTHVASYGDSMHPPTVATRDELEAYYRERLADAQREVADWTDRLEGLDRG